MAHLHSQVYRLIVRVGLATLQRLFPADFQSEPLKPTDRYIEYPFAIRNLPSLGSTVLDVGCAGSFFPLLLAAFGYDTYAIDLREYAIINRLTIDNFHFIQGDIRRTDFPDNFFDAITAISTVEHISLSGRYGADEDPEGDRHALREMTRILKPGGCILLTIPFGQAQVFRPWSRIYDSSLMRALVNGLVIDIEEYYVQDSQDDWHISSGDQAEQVPAQPDRYALCLLKLCKE